MAANITLKLNGNINAVKVTNAEWARILAFHQGLYTTRDDQGLPIVPDEPQTVAYIFADLVNRLTENTLRANREAAAQVASDAVAAITPTADVPV